MEKNMLQNERLQQIYAIISERESVTVQYLQKHLFVSEATIRRDLDELEKEGLISRVWGGAIISSSVEKDYPNFVRDKANNETKSLIAKTASVLLHDNCSMFINSSTTCFHLVPYIQNFKHITVVTSSIPLMQMLLEHTSASVHLIGGQVFEQSIMTGHVAVSSVKNYHTDLMFFSCSGVASDGELTSIESKVVEVTQEMMRCSDRRILMCDSSKFGKKLLWHFADAKDVDHIVTDSVPKEFKDAEAFKGKLVTAPEQFRL